MTADRARIGWGVPDLAGVVTRIAQTDSEARALAQGAPGESVHICQGIRSNGRVGVAQQSLAKLGLRQWVVMETVDDAGVRGVLKRIEYARLFRRWRSVLDGVLATGRTTRDWVVARGVPADRVFPFAYFLPERQALDAATKRAPGPFRFVFVGQFIECKRLDLLIRAMRTLAEQFDFELWVVGSGPLETSLRHDAESALPGRVRWIGRLPQDQVPGLMARADCLVLPSRHDGWGAVVSEALMAGVPVISSDACGAAAAVMASGVGGVFRKKDESDLIDHLRRAMAAGPIGPAERYRLSEWSSALGASAGADYLLEILAHRYRSAIRPRPPWLGRSPEGGSPAIRMDHSAAAARRRAGSTTNDHAVRRSEGS